MAITLMISWPIQGIVDFDFHEICFALPLVAMALDAIDSGSRRYFIVSAFFLLLVREDMGFVVAMLGVSKLFSDSRKKYSDQASRINAIIGVLTIISGTLLSLVATHIIIPHFSGSAGYSYWDYPNLGSSFSSAAKTLLTKPPYSTSLFVDSSQKIFTLAILFFPFLFIFPPWCLAVLPLIAERFLSSRESLWEPRYHYNALPYIIIFLSSVDALR